LCCIVAARRSLAFLLLLYAGCLRSGSGTAPVVNDITQLNPIVVDQTVTPRSADEVSRLLRRHDGPISIAGGRYSMGGQIATEQALLIDMRQMDRVIAFSPDARTITVEAGITWREIQEAIDPYDLSLKCMQSYANFTVGGSLSVNVHGRYVNQGSLIHAVESIEIVLADGRLVHASREENAEVFYGAIGGYGGLGVIVAATLELEPNEKLERRVDLLPVAEYPRWFMQELRGSPMAVFHNGDLYPPAYDTVLAITYSRTARDVTVPDRLRAAGRSYLTTRLVYMLISDLPFGQSLRRRLMDPWRFRGREVVWRNYEASYAVQEIEPFSRKRSSYVLQEYFVPVGRFSDFLPKMREILQRHRADVVNISIRHAVADGGSLLAWAREECFAFVVYYRQGVTSVDRTDVGLWTRELIDAVLSVGGSYYLPYQIHATDEQFHRAYPRAAAFFALKRRLDPTYKFRNKLWDRYLPPSGATARAAADAAIAKKLASRPRYRRPEDQTYLTLPEWYIVYSADEYADMLGSRHPSEFPYFSSGGQFWSIYSKVSGAGSGGYNWGYHAMIWTIGASFTAEYAVKGVYERTLGRLTELLTLRGANARRTAEDRFMADVAREYATFIHATPWYEFGFRSRLRDLWALPRDRAASYVRALERKMALTLDLGTRAVWGALMKMATGAAYAPEDLEVQAWVRPGTVDPTSLYPGVRMLERLDDESVLLAIPRYEPFTRAIDALGRAQVRFVEIAGNRRIMLTVTAPSTWDGARLIGGLVHEWPLLTAPGRKRVALSVPVDRLHVVIQLDDEEGVKLDHVYDY
jgi:FAD/FMN-containing dehydrogenase